MPHVETARCSGHCCRAFCIPAVHGVGGLEAFKALTVEGVNARYDSDEHRFIADMLVDLLAPMTAWLEAKAATDSAREAVTGPLYSLVHGKATLQAVAAVWPEAMRLADRFEGVRLEDEKGAARIASAAFAPPPA